MEESSFSLEDLEEHSYRDLQQLAKSLQLPSNVKKIYLIQLIYAKKYKTAAEVDLIVQRVRYERQRMSQVRKHTQKRRTNLQGTEISSTSNSQSPPIISTPKRRGHIIQYSPNFNTLLKYPRPSMLRPFIKKLYSPNTIQSDRVLRSYNMKPKETVNNSLLSVVKVQNPVSPQENKLSIIRQSLNPKMNVRANCMVRKQRPTIIQSQSSTFPSQLRGQLVPVRNRMNIIPHVPSKRQRVLSGIYPIATKEAPKVSYEYIQSVGFRQSDGSIAKINALVQKSNKEPENYRNIELTVQDIINSNVQSITNQNVQSIRNQNVQETRSLEYPNMSGVSECEPNYPRNSEQPDVGSYDVYEENQQSVYYHKKIRAEQIRCHRRDSMQMDIGYEEERHTLPQIQDVFSRFRDVHGRELTQPIYVQVSEEAERIFNYPVYTNKASISNTTMLETIYNFKNQFLVSQPLLQIATTTATRCVFSTPLIATPAVHTSTVGNNHACVSSCERDNQPFIHPESVHRVNEYLKAAEQDVMTRRNYRHQPTEDFSTSGSSLDRSSSEVQESTATIPEMVEDAMEIISQDGDYMERIGMDVPDDCVQCMICSWAGPRCILEYHIRKDHASQVELASRGICTAVFSLGALCGRVWRTRVVELRGQLYLVSARYEPPDCFMATLSMLSSDCPPKVGHITVYNKVTGEPFSWSGEVLPISANMPYHPNNCLTVNISSLDLLPNSANLVLMNRELMIKSPGKVIVGRPELDDINIVLYIKIVD